MNRLRTMLCFRALPRIVAVLLATACPIPADPFFNPDTTLDVSQVEFVPGQRWCPKLGTWDEEKTMPGKCLVDLVEGVKPVDRSRPDWAEAMRKCTEAGYTQAECEESVGDGEF